MEPWITPTIFEEVNVGEYENKIVDEYTYAQYVDKDFAAKRLDRFKNYYFILFVHSFKYIYDMFALFTSIFVNT